MRDRYRFLLGLLVALLFLFPWPRRIVHDTLVASLYVPVLKMEALSLELLRLRQERDYLLGENARLAEALGRKPFSGVFRSDTNQETALPLKFEPMALPERIVIDKGKAQGLRYGDVVMSGGAFAGRVSDLQQRTALLVTPFSPGFVAGVMDGRTGVLGVFKGGPKPRVDYVPNWEDVAAGDTLLTSGLGGFLPRGIPLAVVDNVYKTDRPFLKIKAKPLYRPSRLASFVIIRRSSW